jgi:hypothetical protein
VMTMMTTHALADARVRLARHAETTVKPTATANLIVGVKVVHTREGDSETKHSSTHMVVRPSAHVETVATPCIATQLVIGSYAHHTVVRPPAHPGMKEKPYALTNAMVRIYTCPCIQW